MGAAEVDNPYTGLIYLDVGLFVQMNQEDCTGR